MSELRDCKERIKELSNEIINLEEELLCLQRQFEVESQHCAPIFAISTPTPKVGLENSCDVTHFNPNAPHPEILTELSYTSRNALPLHLWNTISLYVKINPDLLTDLTR
ncbi:uncharacterized protein LOC135121215 [Zophobas morio]|uniref:uncharacterized protein LOC135121215 n=1 Tax=Zophobas morio TaxID=2755281 RepID=UPI003082B997